LAQLIAQSAIQQHKNTDFYYSKNLCYLGIIQDSRRTNRLNFINCCGFSKTVVRSQPIDWVVSRD